MFSSCSSKRHTVDVQPGARARRITSRRDDHRPWIWCTRGGTRHCHGDPDPSACILKIRLSTHANPGPLIPDRHYWPAAKGISRIASIPRRENPVPPMRVRAGHDVAHAKVVAAEAVVAAFDLEHSRPEHSFKARGVACIGLLHDCTNCSTGFGVAAPVGWRRRKRSLEVGVGKVRRPCVGASRVGIGRHCCRGVRGDGRGFGAGEHSDGAGGNSNEDG